MVLDWFFFAVVAGAIYGGVELFDKFVLDQEVERASVSTLMAKIPNFLVFAAVGVLQAGFAFSRDIFFTSLVLAFLYIVSSYFYYVGIKQEDISRFIPTLSINSVFVVVLSFVFLGEKFGFTEYAGMALTVVGAVLISLDRPRRGIRIFQSREALGVGVLAALLWAVRDVILKAGTSSTGFFQLLFWIGVNGIALSILFSILLYSRMDRAQLKGYEHLLLIGALTSAGYLSAIKAFSLGPVSLASAVVKIDSAIVFLGSILITELHPEIIRERLGKRVLVQKAVALAMILGGVLMIQLF